LARDADLRLNPPQQSDHDNASVRAGQHPDAGRSAAAVTGQSFTTSCEGMHCPSNYPITIGSGVSSATPGTDFLSSYAFHCETYENAERLLIA